MNTKKEFVLGIDGNALLNFGYYATLNDNSCQNSCIKRNTLNGEPSNAASFFINACLLLLSKIKPDYFVVAWDSNRLIRKDLFKAYKANRKEKPDNLVTQFKLTIDILDSFGIKQLRFTGYEADDIIGNLSNIYKDKKFYKFFLTGDRDLFQLINDNTSILYMKAKKMDMIIEYDIPEDNIFPYSIKVDRVMCKRYVGVYPEQITDLKGLGGDTSDCIPGVKGISEKTAAGLLDKYSTLKNVFENLDKIKENRVKNAISKVSLEKLKEFKLLATLFPIEKMKNITPDKFIKKLNISGLYKKLSELGFEEIIKVYKIDTYAKNKSKDNTDSNIKKNQDNKNDSIKILDKDNKSSPLHAFQITPEEKKENNELLLFIEKIINRYSNTSIKIGDLLNGSTILKLKPSIEEISGEFIVDIEIVTENKVYSLIKDIAKCSE